MSLPKIKTPTYYGKVASTDENFKFRPFLVGEQKVLIMALESDDILEIYSAFNSILETCIVGFDSDDSESYKKKTIENMASFDAESVFLQIASKSVGEVSPISHSCKECGKDTKIKVDMSSATLKNHAGSEKTIQLTDDIGVIMKYMTLKDVIKEEMNGNNDTKKEVDPDDSEKTFYNPIISSLESIYDEENVYPVADSSRKEIIEFIDSLSFDHLKKIEKFFDSMPYLGMDIKFKCSSCGAINEAEIKGIKNFF